MLTSIVTEFERAEQEALAALTAQQGAEDAEGGDDGDVAE